MNETKQSTSKTDNNSAKDVIKAYLDNRAKEDPLFAASYAKPKKNIDECFRYILGEARKRGNSVCMADDEVFGLAVHYYDEDDITVSKNTGGFRATATAKPQQVELTEEEKEKLRKEAMEKYRSELIEQQRAINQKNIKNKKTSQPVNVGSLFD